MQILTRRTLLTLLTAVALYAIFTLRQARWTAIAAPGDGAGFALLVTFGHRDTQPKQWDGEVQAEGGKILRAEGWRLFETDGDAVLSPTSWKVRSHREQRYGVIPEKTQSLQYWAEPPGQPSPSGLYLFGDGGGSTQLRFKTLNGEFAFRLSDLAWDHPVPMLGGDVEVSRVASPVRISPDYRENDFPSIAIGKDGTAWAAWQSYTGGRDEIHLAQRTGGEWRTYSPLPVLSSDVWRPQVAVDGAGVVWVVSSQQIGGNWDVVAVAHRGNRVDTPVNLSSSVGPDINARVATDSAGRVYVVWQGSADKFSRIYLRYLEQGRWSERVEISPAGVDYNNWEPAIAADSRGAVHIAWDTYRNGNYDVYMRSFTAPGKLGAERAVAVSPRYEAHAAIACDRRNRVWVAWESGLANWGKDLVANAPTPGTGTALGDDMEVKVRVFDGGAAMMPIQDPQTAFAANERSRSRYPEITIDSEDRPWVVARHITLKGRSEKYTTTRGRGHWAAWITCYNGDRWTPAQMLPESVGRISSFTQLAPMPGGGVWAVWNGDGRDWLDLLKPAANQVFAGYIPGMPSGELKLEPRQEPVVVAQAGHPRETDDLKSIRGYRASAAGKEYRIVRGDFHRHAELSRDQGGSRDGSILDFYRYMLDAASMDFGALTEHSNGFVDYWNWLVEKTVDLHHRSGYTSFYAYERTATYPFGHRNVVHARRGVPLVDFFARPGFKLVRPSVEINGSELVENDTTLLHQSLQRSGGISIAHTTATGHGTDWTQYNPEVEPVVEIYQGLRNNFEREDAPRAMKGGKDFKEPGLVSNAWKKGHRLGVIASSDHVSTHTSYAMVFTESTGRQSILDAIKMRHTYGATDNIVLDCRVGDHLMGDEFAWTGPVALRIKAQATANVSLISVIKDNVVVYTTSPNSRSVDLTWRDGSGSSGRSFYYVRLEQSDGQLAWSSPFWVDMK